MITLRSTVERQKRGRRDGKQQEVQGKIEESMSSKHKIITLGLTVRK